MQLDIPQAWQPTVQQQVYRRLLYAMARPGTTMDLHAFVGSDQRAAVVVLAALLDHTTSLCDLDEVLAPQLRRLLMAPSAAQDEAHYLLASAARAPDADLQPRLGTLSNPELGATIVLDGASVGQGALKVALRGPGIPGERRLALNGFHRDWLTRRAQWVAHFPLGVDLILTDSTRIACLPRTTRAVL
jgi:alpha-D-ribose 1-methylphosphonate 5-triphosphate synthase subunit PhnH